MMAALLTLLLAVGGVGYVAWPLARRTAAAPSEEPGVDVLRERQEAAVDALRELDYERQIGKLTDAEYFALRERYARQAMALLKVLDQRDAAREQTVERAIAARRGASGRPAPVRGRSSATTAPKRRRWLTASAGAALALLVAAVLLVSTVHQGTAQPEAVGRVTLPSPVALTFDPARRGRLLAANATSLAASDDGGKTWTTLPARWSASGSPAPPAVASLAPAPDGQGLWALARGLGLQLSRDGGQTWSPLANAPRLPNGARALAETTNPALLIVATTDGIQASSDNGASWAIADGFVNGLLPTRDTRDVAYAATADVAIGPRGQTFRGVLLVATDSGLYASNDGGQSWFARPLGGDLVAVAADPANPRSVFAMDSAGQLFRSDDGGQTWLARNG